jgi:pheromone alpha factor receptor
MVALLLPFSSLWASAAIDNESASLNIAYLAATQEAARRGSASDHSNLEAGKTNVSQMSHSTAQSGFEYYGNNELKGTLAPINTMGVDSRAEHIPNERRDSTEMDLEAMGVRVDHSYSVRSN